MQPGPSSSMGQQGEPSETQNVSEKAAVVDDCSRSLSTPLEIISELCILGYFIESEVYKWNEEMYGINPDGKWKVVFSCGNIKVESESGLKMLAKESGASVFIKELERHEILTNPISQHSQIPEACFYDPAVEMNLTKELELQEDLTILTESEVKDKRLLFTAKLTVAGQTFSSSNSNLSYAKIHAAKSAYEFISNQKLKKYEYRVVLNPTNPNANYTLTETIAKSARNINTSILLPPTRRHPARCRNRRMAIEMESRPDFLDDPIIDPLSNLYRSVS